MIINTNPMSLFARRVGAKSGDQVNTVTSRLSSGLRINSAADDAAGLAISERLSTQINGQTQAKRNINDGVSVVQTAEGALTQSVDILQRLRTLAVQSANGTNSSADRESIDTETQQLIEEFDRISSQTEFNTKKLLDGSTLTSQLQAGFKSTHRFNFGIQSTKASELYSYDLASDVTAATSLAAAQTATSDGNVNQRNRLQAQNLSLYSKGQTGAVVLQAGVSAKEVAGRINNALVQQRGLVSARAETFAMLSFSGTDYCTFDFRLNGVSIQAGSRQANLDLDDLVLSINNMSSATGVVASTQNLAGGAKGVLLHAANGEDIQLTETSISMGSGGSAGTATVQGGFDNQGSFASVGGAVALTAGGSNTSRNTTVGGRVIMVNDSAFTIRHNAAGGTGGLFATPSSSWAASIKGGTLLNVSLSTVSSSNTSLGIIDAVLERVNTYRSNLGAIQNSLGFKDQYLANDVEQTSASRSRIRDANFAEETANLLRLQVLQQASQSMLAQANASSSRALELIK